MIPVHQQSLYDPESDTGGDCWRCCIASILELPADDVPDFVNEHGNRYVAATREWLKERGLWFIETRYHGNFPGYMIASGPSPRDKSVFHSVVWKGADMAHDPHPSGEGIYGPVYEWTLLVPINPAAMLLRTAGERN